MLLFKKVMDNIVDFYKNNCKNKNTTRVVSTFRSVTQMAQTY